MPRRIISRTGRRIVNATGRTAVSGGVPTVATQFAVSLTHGSGIVGANETATVTPVGGVWPSARSLAVTQGVSLFAVGSFAPPTAGTVTPLAIPLTVTTAGGPTTINVVDSGASPMTSTGGQSYTASAGGGSSAITVPSFSALTLPVLGTGAAAGTVVTTGLVFARGHCAAGNAPVLKRADGTTVVSSQSNIMTTWTDGSAKHVIVHFVPPTLSNGVTENLGVTIGSPIAGTALDLVAQLSGRTASVTITPTTGGSAWTYDLIAHVPGSRWWTGKHAVSARVSTPIPSTALSGAAGCRLVADLVATSDGALEVDIAVCNDSVVTGNASAKYSITLTGDAASTQMSYSAIVAPRYSRFLRRRRYKSGGTAAPTRPWVTPPTTYMADSGAVLRFDATLGTASSFISNMAANMAAGTWDVPYDSRAIAYDFGTSGGRDEIGPSTKAGIGWLVSGSPTLQQYVMDQAETAASISWHGWDESIGAGVLVNNIDHPNAGFFSQGIFSLPADDPWNVEVSHMGQFSFLPYLLTGRRSCLDLVLSQASLALMSSVPNSGGVGAVTGADVAARLANLRNIGTAGVYPEGMGVHNDAEVRQVAWLTRALVDAAYVGVASEVPHGTYYTDYLAALAWNWHSGIEAFGVTYEGNIYGYLPGWAYGTNDGLYAPWQHGYWSTQLPRMCRAELSANVTSWALAFTAWANHFQSGRIANGVGLGSPTLLTMQNPADSTIAYNIGLGRGNVWPPYNQNFVECYAGPISGASSPSGSTVGINFALTPVDVAADYVAIAQCCNATMLDIFTDAGMSTGDGLAITLTAKSFLDNVPAAKTFTTPAYYQDRSLQWSVVPRGTTRG